MGDGILGWKFVIYGRLGKVDRSSIKNKTFCGHMGWDIGLVFCDRLDIGKGFSDVSSFNNQQFRDLRRWVIGMRFCD